MRQSCLERFFSVFGILFIIWLSIPNDISAQNMQKMDKLQIDQFLKTLSDRSLSINTLSSGFKQVKNMEMLKRDMVSEGLFYYMKDDKIAFIYEKPGRYSMVMNGNFLKMGALSGSTKIDLSANPVMNQINDLITAVFTGTLKTSTTNYEIEFEHTDDTVHAVVTPRSSRISSIISRIDIFFKKAEGDIKEIAILEGSGSTTSYLFFNQQINKGIDDEIFKIN